MSLKEWPVASTRICRARATMACSWLTVAGRWKSGAAKAMLPAQFVRGRSAESSATLTPGRDGLGPDRRQRPAEPGLDDVPGDRHRRGQRDLAGPDRGEQLVPAEPVRLGEFGLVDGDGLARGSVGAEAEHPAARHRPGLAAD